MADTQWAGVLNALQNDDWQQVEQLEASEWWLLRQVKLTQRDQTLYLTLLTDPLNGQAKSSAWAIAFDFTLPADRVNAGRLGILPLKRWQKNLAVILESLDQAVE